MGHSVGEVAKLARVTIRTLHHYDEIGLLVPSERSAGGYRLYSTDDLARLQQVLFYKELGFTLEEIRNVMNDPSFDRREALVAQRALISEQIRRLEAVLRLVDKTIRSTEEMMQLSEEEMFEVFGEFNPREHEEEARERWGATDAYAESARRTARYGKDDWKRFKSESDEVNRALAELMERRVPATDAQAMQLAEQHRQQIDRWFYPCSHEMHRGLARMYVTDPRFTATYDKVRAGLAEYLAAAIEANAARNGK